ncbi:MAG: hypothetical protein IIC13_15355 [SAR324 cluster bacterium]|nr:hypothetical protein [SAR324 cluster bacterium]MCH8887959.1 hypothetical protein [SAR324 cluster bacterium]
MAREVKSFELFCWYYLGLSPKGEYSFVNGNKVAKIYNWTVGDLLHILKKQGLDPDLVLNTDFPMARYQVDVQMAAQQHGPDHALEFASRIYEDFKQRMGRRRDWAAEIEREREEDRDRRREGR